MRILAIDPGSERSAVVQWHGHWEGDADISPITGAMIVRNESLVDGLPGGDHLAIEMLRPRGMPTAWEEMLTCVWIGRFIQAWNYPWSFVYRKDVKMHLCGSMRAKDSNIRQALIDRFGGKEKAIGKKANPGQLYGIKKDLWQALAVAVTFADQQESSPAPVEAETTPGDTADAPS